MVKSQLLVFEAWGRGFHLPWGWVYCFAKALQANLAIFAVIFVFALSSLGADKKPPAVPDIAKKSDGADIGLTIMGTIVQKKAENNVALVKESKSGKVQALKPGYKILNDYVVVEITGKYMILERNQEKQLVYQDKFAGEFSGKGTPSSAPAAPAFTGEAPEFFKEEGFERQASQITMTGAYRDKLIGQDMAQILMQATAEPHMENGQVVGFKLTQIDAGSIYWKGGLKDEDVITEINGQKLDSVARAIGVLKALKQENQVEVGVLRGGAVTRITLRVN